MARVKLVQQVPKGVQSSLNQDEAYRRRGYQQIPPSGEGRTGLSDPEDPGAAAASIGRDYAGDRIPTIVTTQQYFVEGVEARGARGIISLWVNPSSVSWTVPRREVLQKVRSGGVRYSWRKRARGTGAVGARKKRRNAETVFDEFTLALTFQTGNIWTHPKGSNRGDVPPGADDFYNFLALLNEERLLPDGRENWHIIVHSSPLFPRIVFKGWFTPEGLSWSESADAGFGMQWTCNMEVHESTPKLWDDSGLRQVFGVVRR